MGPFHCNWLGTWLQNGRFLSEDTLCQLCFRKYDEKCQELVKRKRSHVIHLSGKLNCLSYQELAERSENFSIGVKVEVTVNCLLRTPPPPLYDELTFGVPWHFRFVFSVTWIRLNHIKEIFLRISFFFRWFVTFSQSVSLKISIAALLKKKNI